MSIMELQLGNHRLDLRRPRVMGIVNVTPDSFSDGGRLADVPAAVDHAATLAKAGAAIIDVGGESTRPGAEDVPAALEIDRVCPVIERVTASIDMPVSIDTSKPEVMRAAVEAGAAMINDVYALRRPGATETVAALDVAVCLMHMQGEPRTMQANPSYEKLPDEVIDFLFSGAWACIDAGIDRRRLVVDPGFGFGKTDAHNLEILANLDAFASLGLPLLVGLSRKRTLGNLTGKPVGERVAAGLAAAVIAVRKGARIVRTHDVAETADALAVVATLEEMEQD